MASWSWQCDNPPGMKFCAALRTRPEAVCPNCQASNLSQLKFCRECGHNLTSPVDIVLPNDLFFDEKLLNIQKSFSSGLTEKVLSQRNRIGGERRRATIMFVDMKGFTPLTEKLGPEETFSLFKGLGQNQSHHSPLGGSRR